MVWLLLKESFLHVPNGLQLALGPAQKSHFCRVEFSFTIRQPQCLSRVRVWKQLIQINWPVSFLRITHIIHGAKRQLSTRSHGSSESYCPSVMKLRNVSCFVLHKTKQTQIDLFPHWNSMNERSQLRHVVLQVLGFHHFLPTVTFTTRTTKSHSAWLRPPSLFLWVEYELMTCKFRSYL